MYFFLPPFFFPFSLIFLPCISSFLPSAVILLLLLHYYLCIISFLLLSSYIIIFLLSLFYIYLFSCIFSFSQTFPFSLRHHRRISGLDPHRTPVGYAIRVNSRGIQRSVSKFLQGEGGGLSGILCRKPHQGFKSCRINGILGVLCLG